MVSRLRKLLYFSATIKSFFKTFYSGTVQWETNERKLWLQENPISSIKTLKIYYTHGPTGGHLANGPLVLEKADGVYIYDDEGNRYLEGMAGLWCTSLGYGNEELAQAAYDQIKKLSYAQLFTSKSYDVGIELAEKLNMMVPFERSKVFFGNSGSDANDTQIKLVWYYNNALGRPKKKDNQQT